MDNRVFTKELLERAVISSENAEVFKRTALKIKCFDSVYGDSIVVYVNKAGIILVGEYQ